MGVPVCPLCGSRDNQVKAGKNGDRQRYKCTGCLRRYVLEPSARGYSDALRQRALALHGQGVSVGAISRRLDVTGQTVRNWLRAGSAPEGRGTPHPQDTPPAPPRDAAPFPGPANRRPTIDDVARQAGVSRSTVSNLLNSKGRMAEATRTRVQDAMDALHFAPSALVRAIHRRRTRVLGVLIFGLADLGRNNVIGAATSLLAGISAAADAAGHNMLLYTGWDRGAGRHAALEFLDGHIDGLIWVAPAIREPALERLAEAGLPTVALLSRHVPEGIGYVNADNIGGVSEAVSYLGALGHRRIAYIGSDHDSNFLDRRAGYRAGLAALGLGYDPSLDVLGDRSAASTRDTLTAWRALPSPPTAIIVPNDSWAEEIGANTRENGLRVPEDISITGFDDNSNTHRILGGLTTVRQPFRQMGQVAGERLLALINGAPASECRLTIPTELILRASTAPPRNG